MVLCDIPTCLITCRKCQNWRTSRTKRSFCCAHVSRLESLVFLWRRRIYGGSCKTSVSSRVSACPLASPCLWGKLQSLACFAALTSPSLWWKLQNLSLCLSSGVAVSMGEAAKPISSRVSACPLASPCHGESCKASLVLLRSRRRVYGGSCKTSVSSRVSACPLASLCLWWKLQNLACFAALMSSRVYAYPLASPWLWGKLPSFACFAALTSPCLWGKLQNFSLVSSFCLSSGVAVSIVEAKPRLFCCAHVVSSFCLSSGVAVSMGKAAKPRVFCCAHVAVSMGEAAKPRVCASFVVNGSTGTCLYKLCSTQYWVKALSCLR